MEQRGGGDVPQIVKARSLALKRSNEVGIEARVRGGQRRRAARLCRL
jgi:hypothetical protein